MKGIILLLALTFFFPLSSIAQTSLIGGVNVHFKQDEPFTALDYFGGIEFKIHPWQSYGLWQNIDLYFTPQYNGLKIDNYRLRNVMMPVGITYNFNALWDEETTLFRVIDISAGGYAGYIFMAHENEEEITDSFSFLDYGVQLSAKFRIFVFYPLYISYNYAIATLNKEGQTGFNASYLQFGVYFPVSTLLKIY